MNEYTVRVPKGHNRWSMAQWIGCRDVSEASCPLQPPTVFSTASIVRINTAVKQGRTLEDAIATERVRLGNTGSQLEREETASMASKATTPTSTPATLSPPPQFLTVPVAQLRESATNPRKHYDTSALKDLTESIRTKGVLVPILARRKNGHYEIIAGSRRYRAAKDAGLQELPTRIVDLSDEEALEVQVIENLQREDVHPLDEAIGYRKLLELGHRDVKEIAGKVGKSETYVYQRLKLADLIPAAQKAFWQEKLTLKPALLLARLQPLDQEAALKEFGQGYRGGVDKIDTEELADYIEENVHLQLGKVPWKLDDGQLLPKAGSCVNCPKRTGANPVLFPDVKKKDVCTDSVCFKSKLEAFVKQQADKLKGEGKEVVLVSSAYGQEKGVLREGQWRGAETKECPHRKYGILVSSSPYSHPRRERGEILQVCTEKKCKVHFGSETSPYRSSGGGFGRSEEEKARQRKAVAIMSARETVARQVLQDRKWPPSDAEFTLLCQGLVSRLDFDSLKRACKVMDIWPKDGKTLGFDFRHKAEQAVAAADLDGVSRWFIVALIAPDTIHREYYGGGNKDSYLAQIAGAMKLDIKSAEKAAIAAANSKYQDRKKRVEERQKKNSAKGKQKGAKTK